MPFLRVALSVLPLGLIWLAHRRMQFSKAAIDGSRLDAILECTHIGVFFADQHGNWTFASPALEQLTGLTQEQLAGRGWIDAVEPEQRARAEHDWIEAVQLQESFTAEHQLCRPDRGQSWCKVHTTPVHSGGALVGYLGTFEDMTDRVLAREELELARVRISATLETIPDCFLSLDSDWTIKYVNQAAAEMLGEQVPDLIGRCLIDIDPEIKGSVLELYCKEVLQTGEPRLFETEDEGRNGGWYEVRIYPAPKGISVFYHDISFRKVAEQQVEESMLQISEYSIKLEIQQNELEAVNSKLENLATTDGLTGLKNHRTFQEKISHFLTAAIKDQEPLSLLLLDVDKFKLFNDSFGHQAGDEVLREVAAILTSVAHDGEVVARYGGEEFVIILPQTDRDAALESGERYRAAIEAGNWTHRQVTASFGASTFVEGVLEPSVLVSEADQALYVSKRRGRNRVTHFDDTREGRSLLPAKSDDGVEACGADGGVEPKNHADHRGESGSHEGSADRKGRGEAIFVRPLQGDGPECNQVA
jgi:diguanylate cyclase (GGDEF)-like protein/PAS domain S-box-containing protein